MRVNEIFYSLQGEGARAGMPSIFIRLAGCNLECEFCDTEFESGREMTLEEIRIAIGLLAPTAKWIVWSGGEPMLQLRKDSLQYFKDQGYFNAIETNGSVAIDASYPLDFITCSPKIAEHVMARKFGDLVIDELKYVRNHTQGIPEPMVVARRRYVSPEFSADPAEVRKNLDHCIRLCLENPDWSLSVQQHKIWKVR